MSRDDQQQWLGMRADGSTTVCYRQPNGGALVRVLTLGMSAWLVWSLWTRSGPAGELSWQFQTLPIIIIMLPNQAIASTPSAPRPSGAEGTGSTAPLCLQLLRTSQACTRYSAILLEVTRHLPLLPKTSSDTQRNNLVKHCQCNLTLYQWRVFIRGAWPRALKTPALHASSLTYRRSAARSCCCHCPKVAHVIHYSST
jgi:hypothetical protein